jgi:hypothetical protein
MWRLQRNAIKCEIRGKISWRGESDGRKRDLKWAVVVTNGLSRRTMAEEKRGWTSSGRGRGYMGWDGVERARKERTGPANGWKLGYPPSRALEQRVASRGQRQGSEICGQGQRRALRLKSKPICRGAAWQRKRSRRRRTMSRGCSCAEWAAIE